MSEVAWVIWMVAAALWISAISLAVQIKGKNDLPSMVFVFVAFIFGLGLFAQGFNLKTTDSRRAEENARVTIELESRYQDINVVKLSVWHRTVRFTLSDKICFGELAYYRNEWLIEQDPICDEQPSH